MNKQNQLKDSIIVGCALFAIYFGAGNLIFPPTLGVTAGDNWVQAMLGFLTTDPIFPVIGTLVTVKVGGKAQDLGKRVGLNFSKAIQGIAIIILAALFAVPRTASTTHEILVQQIFPGVPQWVTSLVFFGLTALFVLKQSKVIDIVGKYLTPGLVIILAAIIIACIINPIGEIKPVSTTGLYRTGFYEGYQTMDALGSALMAGIVVSDLVRRGYKTRESQFKVSIGVGIVCCILLAFVYGGLTYVGATASGQFTPETSRIDILLGCVYAIFGSTGKTLMGICVALACLTTSVGLSSTSGDFFESATKGKLSYKVVVLVSISIAFFFSLIGVDGIIKIAIPVLLIIYPVVMVLIIYNIFEKHIKYNLTITGAVVGTLIVSIFVTMHDFFAVFKDTALGKLITEMPLKNIGFEWLIPALVVSLVFTFIAAATQKGGVRSDVIED